MLEKLIKSFNQYTSNYDMSIKEISLKYNHSFEVMNLMGELAFRLNLDKEKNGKDFEEMIVEKHRKEIKK